MGELSMYDVSSKFNVFYRSYVVLPQSEQSELFKKKDLNIQRLKDGLEEYNSEHKTDYKVVDTCVQGSVAMSTVVQNEDSDYDIDVAVIFDKADLRDKGAQATRNIVANALKRKTKQFNAEPEVKTSCVRIKYADGYHIDFAIYQRYYDECKDDWVYEHAGSDWTERELTGLTDWFKTQNDEADALKVIESLIETELKVLDSNDEYTNAVDVINKLQQDVLDNISRQIISPMREFLPALRNIQIKISNDKRRNALRRNAEIIIDDGTATSIQQKGDGIKSLTALAMLNISEQRDCVSVIAIEEPESHLHPESARQLYDTICSLALNHQVVLTTHSPLFVNRTNLSENIIVNEGKAIPVKKVKEIRDVLGIKVSDNLVNAENILIVEGEDDKIALERILPSMSEKARKALQNGTLLIDYIGGAGNLPYKLSFYRNLQCKYHVLLDNDDAGRQAGAEAEEQGLLEMRNTTYTVCNGSPNAEIEDCYEKEVYAGIISDKYGVDINVPEFRNNHKWSDRIADCFKSQGKQWNSTVEKKVKLAVANSLPITADRALNQYKRSSIDALVAALERLL